MLEAIQSPLNTGTICAQSLNPSNQIAIPNPPTTNVSHHAPDNRLDNGLSGYAREYAKTGNAPTEANVAAKRCGPSARW